MTSKRLGRDDFRTKKSRPCFQGRDANIPWCHLSSPVIRKHRPRRVRAVSSGKHRYTCAVMGAPIIVLARRQGPAFGMRLQGVIRLPIGSFVLRSRLSRCKTKYLFLYPFSAAGILCNISRYLLVLFTALSGMIVAWFFFAVNTELWVRTVRCSIAVL